MTDPMMDFFDDANLFGETLEGLSDDTFVQPGPVSLVDELNLGAEFEPLHIDSLNHVQGTPTHQKMADFEQLSQFDSMKFHPVNQSFGSPVEHVLSPHSQFNCSPIHPPNQPNGLFQDVADGSPMWGHQTATGLANQNGSPFTNQDIHTLCIKTKALWRTLTLPYFRPVNIKHSVLPFTHNKAEVTLTQGKTLLARLKIF